MQTFGIIDGSDLMYRAYFAMPDLHNAQGFPTAAIKGMLNFLEKIHKQHDATWHVVFDVKGKNHRHELHPGYKQHRKPMPEALQQQWPLMQELLIDLGYPLWRCAGVEGDDVIAALAKKWAEAGHAVVIVGHDKDLFQCINERISVYQPAWNRLYTPQSFQEKYGLSPRQWVDYLALNGDQSDGFAGIPGVGPKTAVQWLSSHHDLAGIWEHRHLLSKRHREHIEAFWEQVKLNQQLARLRDDLVLNESHCMHAPNPHKAETTLAMLEIRSVKMRSSPRPVEALSPWEAIDWSVQEGPRYWHIESHDDGLHVFLLWKAQCFKGINPDLRHINWAPWDIFWDSMPWYRLGCAIPVEALDCSIYLYALDSGQYHKNLKETAQMLGMDAQMHFALPHIHAFCLQQPSPHYPLERALLPILAKMEQQGIFVHAETLDHLAEACQKGMQERQAEVNTTAGRPINMLSPRQLREWIYGDLGAKGQSKTEQGEWSTAESALEGLVDDFPILSKVLDYRMLAKMKSTYCDGLRSARQEGRVHTHYQPRGTITGRLSSRNPNLQNIPIRGPWGRMIRSAFQAGEGHVLLSADYSQIELRILAHLSEDPQMLESLRSGMDIHARTAAWIFDCQAEEVSSEMRRMAKAIQFGLIYGMSAFGLAKQLHIPVEQAKSKIEKYFALYSGVFSYRQRLLEQATRDGYITTIGGRKISLDRMSNRGSMQRLALNAPMQGSSADVLKAAMLAMPKPLQQALRLQVHDELVFELPEDSTEEALASIIQTMSQAASLHVPLVVHAKIGHNWGEMTDVA